MTEQPTALRLAECLTRGDSGYSGQAAAELRRLHAELTESEKWRDRDEARAANAERERDIAEAQRDALLKVLKDVLPVAEDASESLGRFCSDEGWAQEDMDRMDNVDGMLPLIRAAIKAVEGEK